jgi:hypothetical protein
MQEKGKTKQSFANDNASHVDYQQLLELA